MAARSWTTYTRRVKTRPLFASLSLLFVVAACGGATATDLFDSPGTSGTSSSDAAVPTGTTTSTSTSTTPTSTTTTEPPVPDSGPVEAACSAKKPDCAAGFICEVATCNGDGTCVPVGNYGQEPVCGCDKLTYASAALARGSSAVRHAKECSKDEATPCNNGNCSGGAKCNAPVADVAGCIAGTNNGTCWKMPGACPGSASKTSRMCGITGGGCMSACEAVLQNRPYYKAASCP